MIIAKLRSNLLPSSDALNTHQMLLHFQNGRLEAEYLIDVARRRKFVLGFIFVFDVVCFLFRFTMKKVYQSGHTSFRKDFVPQALNMGALYCILTAVNRRSRRLGSSAARQEEFILGGIMTLVRRWRIKLVEVFLSPPPLLSSLVPL